MQPQGGRPVIVRKRPSGWRLFFVIRGSVVPQIAPQIAATMAVAGIVTYFHGVFFTRDLTFTVTPFTIMGLALSIFLGFRNTAAYDRYWEGRRLWGDLIITSRTLARQVFSLIGDSVEMDVPGLRRRMIYKTIGFAHALRHYLRCSDAAVDLKPLLEPDDLHAVLRSTNRPQAIVRSLGGDLRECLARHLVADPLAVSLDASLDNLDRVLAGCERLRTTPIPFSYTLLLHRTAYLYCFLLPFGLVDTVGLATPLVVGLVSYTFFGLDALGDEIEEPFGIAPNDLPIGAMCRTIEINLREALGEQDLPAPSRPDDYVLL
jgi:putative membrane protein